MKKITLLFALLMACWSWHANAQFGCDTAIPITDGYTASGITTPGDGGTEDWNANPVGTSINEDYWDDDVYLFEYTAGATAEEISMTIFTRNGWNGIGIFDDCTGDAFSAELDATGSTSSDASSTVSAVIPAGNTVYIAVGQWGTPNDLDFDVTEFSVTSISCPQPSSVQITAVTDTTAEIEWTAGDAETEWEVIVQEADTGEPTENGVYTTDNPYIATGLQSASNYEVYVRAFCGTDDLSEWVGPESFDTECGVIDAPYTQDFENGGSIPLCWEQGANNSEDWLFADSPGSNYIGDGGDFEGTSTESGGYYAWVNDSSPNNADTALESPLVDISALTNPALSFYLISNAQSGDNVDFSVDIYDGANWNTDVYTSNTNTAGWEQVFIDLTQFTITGPIQARFVVDESGGTDYYDDVAIDDVSFDEMPTCFAPENITVSAVGSDEVTVSWDAFPGAVEYEYVVVFAGLDPDDPAFIDGTTTNTSEVISGLTPVTDFTVYVRSICGDEDSTWDSENFTTECDVFDAPFLETFADSDTPDCWSNTGDAAWEFGTNAGNAASDVEDHTLGGGTNYAWMDGSDNGDGEITTLTTPLIDASTLTTPALIFYAFSDNTNSSAINILEVEFFDGNTWHTLTTIDYLLGSSWQEMVFDLSSYTITGPVQARFTVTGNSNGGSTFHNDILLDDVAIDEMPTCLTPSGLVVNGVTGTTADVEWTAEGDETEWEIIYGPSGFDPTSAGTTVQDDDGTLGETITGLTADTDYDFYVVSVCGDEQSLFAGPGSFFTGYCVSNPSSNDGNGISEIELDDTTFTSGGDLTYEDFTDTPVDLPQGILANTQITFVTGWSYDANVWIDFNDNLIFEDSELLSSGESTSANPTTLDVSFMMPADAPLGQHRMRIGTAYTGQATPDPCYSGSYGVTADLTVNITPAPACIAPSNIEATTILADEATFDWDDFDNAGSYEWVVVFQGLDPDDNAAVANGTVTDSEVVVPGLSPTTAYDFYVWSSCGDDGDSAYSQAIPFTTPCTVFDAPFLEDFADSDTPDCWSNTGDAAWEFSTGAGYAASDVEDHTPGGGTNYAWMDGTDNSDGEVSSLTSPLIDVSTLNTPALIFYAFSNNTNNSAINILDVEFYDGANWNTLTTVDTLLGDDWVELIFNLSDYTITGPVQVRFTVTGNGGSNTFYNDILIDDVAIEEMPSCPTPSGLTLNSITDTTVDVSWSTAGTETEWEILYGEEGFDPANEGTTILDDDGTIGETLTGLNAATDYDVYVRAVCGAGDESNWQGPSNFSTECTVFVAPYVEDFENGGDIPNCWSQGANNDEDWLFADTVGTNHIGDSGDFFGTSSMSGGYFAWVDDSSPNNLDTTLESPLVDVSGLNTPSLSFYIVSDDEGYSNVSFSVDFYDGANWNTEVFTSSTNTGGWTQVFIDLSQYTITGPVQARFIVDEDNGTDFYDDVAIDDVRFDELPTCMHPSEIELVSVTDTTAELSWTAGGSETSWNIEVVQEGTDPTGTPTEVGVSNPHTINGLSAATDYEFYVQADCGGGDESYWVGPFDFTTACSVFDAPYHEDFENGGTIPNCWNQGDNNAEDWLFANTVGTNHIGNSGDFYGTSSISGGYFAWVDDSTPNSMNTTLESPLVDVSDLITPALSFYMVSDDEGYSNVSFSVDIYDGANWNTEVFTSSSNTNGWVEVFVDLSQFNITGPVQARFIVDEDNGTDFYDDFAIDDVKFDELPTCMPPSNIEVTELGDGGTFTWDGPANAVGDYQWVVVESGGDPTEDDDIVASGATSDEQVTIDVLASNTDYDFYVMSDCGDDDGMSIFSISTPFTTLCLAPTAFQVTEPGYEEVTFEWDPVLTSFGYEYIIVESGDELTEDNYVAIGTIGSADQSTLVVEYLEMGVEYDLYLRVVCDTHVYGEWGVETFTTMGVDENNIEGFSFYPNPVKDVLHLEAIDNIESVVVYNMLGQVVKTEKPANLNVTIDMSNLQAGAYVVKVTVGATSGTYRVIKE